jgi:Glycosyltransferase like family
MDQDRFSIVVAVNNHQVLQNNLLRSPSLANGSSTHQIIVEEGFSAAGAAYNSGLDAALNDIVIFIHQDVYLPDGWMQQLTESIRTLEAAGQKWGVLGCFGVTKDHRDGLGQVYSTGLGLIGKPVAVPTPVDTLDEIVLIFRNSSGLRFDPEVPNFHMYGADICLEARQRGLSSYAIPAFCVHNTRQIFKLPTDFRVAYRYMKRKWRHCMPVYTSCTVIERFDHDIRQQDWEQFVARVKRCAPTPMARMDDPRAIFSGEESAAGVAAAAHKNSCESPT